MAKWDRGPLVISGNRDMVFVMAEPKCPKCGVKIGTQATGKAFGEPADWHFWGSKGERWKKCEGRHGQYGFVHFRAVVNGRPSERIFWIEPELTGDGVQDELL